MSESSKQVPLATEEDIACDLQRAEDEAEEKLQNCLEDHENYLQHAFQKAAGTVCRLASERSNEVPILTFQEAATAVTRLYKTALAGQRSLVEASRRCGVCQRSREMYDSCRKVRAVRKTYLRRDDVLGMVAQCTPRRRTVSCSRLPSTFASSSMSPPSQPTSASQPSLSSSSLVSLNSVAHSSSPPSSSSFSIATNASATSLSSATATSMQVPTPSSPVSMANGRPVGHHMACNDDSLRACHTSASPDGCVQNCSARVNSTASPLQASFRQHRQPTWWYSGMSEDILEDLYISPGKRIRSDANFDDGDAENLPKRPCL